MWFLLLSVLALAEQQILSAQAGKAVDLGYATYQSDLSIVPGVTSFLGIRYAASPTGGLRWRAPQAPAKMTEVQNATTQPLQCFQASIAGSSGLSTTNPFRKQSVDKRDTVGVTSEDCLFLNVHVPTSQTSSSPLPVIVYIHGGGYDAGNISVYPVEDFVKASGYGLVAVQIQYRVGLFGFLPVQMVKDGGDLNTGLLDQNFALQWVQRHISLFGGEPSKVTIWGQSAGAGCMLQHMVAHGGRTEPPLFRAILMNSPFLPFQYPFNDPIPETLYSEVVSQVNCTHSVDSLDCLRKVDASLLLDTDTGIGFKNFLGTYSFVPVIDYDFIVERPMETISRGRLNGHTLLVSTNTHEGNIFVPTATLVQNNFTFREYVTQLFPRLNQHQIDQIVNIYSKIGLTAVPDLAAAVMGDSIFVCPAYYSVSAFGQQGRKAMFAVPPAFHAEDLSYEFNTFGIPPTFNNTNFQKAFQDAFLSTAISLNANSHINYVITPEWPDWSQGHTEMLFNKTENNEPVVKTFTTDPEVLERCT
ncbi:hypothetical protein PILCRDRAFT_72971 [Piloderma croceum F 1598]|uniref:Carboxylic ester hydrolase n=1 Tax=Piloderma croceum (strain F 1598) TaxID=765440 RepID=A0A0C3BT81_PILCF|nr:hypothetical protein PILCRDRAFT_72971 [Piloderma croceum F 1598]